MPATGDDLTGALHDLDALAVQEQFLAEWRAGRRPRLSEYVRRYPAHAATLAALVAGLPPDSSRAAKDGGAGAIAGATSTDSFPGRRWQDDLDTGVGRALVTLFGAAAGHETSTQHAREQPLAQVAETPTAYRPGRPAEPEPPEPPAPPESNARH